EPLLELAESLGEDLAFFWRGRASQGQPKTVVDALPRRRAGLFDHSLRELARSFKVSHVVHQVQGLKRSVRPRGSHCTGLPARRVKGNHRRWGNRALPVGVQAPAVKALPFVLFVSL